MKRNSRSFGNAATVAGAGLTVVLLTTLSAGLSTKVACCDAEGWGTAADYTSAVLGDPSVARYVGLITSHGYTAPPNVPLTSDRHVWETEWANFNPFDATRDDGAPGDGFVWAQNIQTALTSANANAVFYFWAPPPARPTPGSFRCRARRSTCQSATGRSPRSAGTSGRASAHS